MARAIRFDPDFAAVYLDDAFNQRQSDAGAADLGAQSFEQSEYLLLKLLGNADTVVLHEATNYAILFQRSDVNPGRRLVTDELDRIFN